jgi:hypothetical protein
MSQSPKRSVACSSVSVLGSWLGQLGRPNGVVRLGKRHKAIGHFVVESSSLRRQHARHVRPEMVLKIEVAQKKIHVVSAIARWPDRSCIAISRANFAQTVAPAPAAGYSAPEPALQTELPSRSSGRVRASDPERALRPLSEVSAVRRRGRKRWMPPAYRVDSDMRTHSITGKAFSVDSRAAVWSAFRESRRSEAVRKRPCRHPGRNDSPASPARRNFAIGGWCAPCRARGSAQRSSSRSSDARPNVWVCSSQSLIRECRLQRRQTTLSLDIPRFPQCSRRRLS